MILSSSRFDSTSNGHPNNNNNNEIHLMSSSIEEKRMTAPPALASVERPQPKRRSPGFLRSLVHESKDVLLAPFHPSRRKRSANFGSDSKGSRDKGTQTRPGDYATFSCQYSAFCGADGGSSTAIFSNANSPRLNSTLCPQHASPGQTGHNLQNGQHYQLHRMRRSSRARSDPFTRCSLTNLSSLSGSAGEWSGAVTHHCPNPVLQSTSTLASSPTLKRQQQQQIYNQNATSQNDLRFNGCSPNGSQWTGSNPGTGQFPPIVCGIPSAATYWQQIRDDAVRGRGCLPQSRTLPARLEPSSLLSPDWPLTSSTTATMLEAGQHLNLTLSNNPPLSLRRLASSASSGGASPLFSACRCPNEMSHRFTSTSSCPSDQQEPDGEKLFLMGSVVMSLYRSLAEPFVEELLRYPWGRDSLWLMGFVVFASTLVLLSYIITTVLPTMLLAICLAICKSLIFRRSETITHLRTLASSARHSMFTRECVQSLRSATLQLLNQTLQLLVPPVIVPTSLQMSGNT